MTVRDFYILLFGEFERQEFELYLGELLSYSSAEKEILERRTAAYMVHKYLLDIKKEEDEPDISPVFRLKDIYECRVCVPHIAQVYIKGIMTANDSLFEGRRPVEDKEAEEIVKKIRRDYHKII